MTIAGAIARSLSAEELCACAKDLISLQDNGSLDEGPLRLFAARLEADTGIDEVASLQHAEAAILRESTLRYLAFESTELRPAFNTTAVGSKRWGESQFHGATGAGSDSAGTAFTADFGQSPKLVAVSSLGAPQEPPNTAFEQHLTEDELYLLTFYRQTDRIGRARMAQATSSPKRSLSVEEAEELDFLATYLECSAYGRERAAEAAQIYANSATIEEARARVDAIERALHNVVPFPSR